MRDRGQESGSAFAYLAVSLFALFMFTGLAIDLGRGYVVKANLSKAVDAAAFAAAKHIGEGQSVARTEANKSFGVNFPAGFLGVSYVESPPRLDFSLASDGANVMTVSATAILPTTFSRIAGFNDMNIFARGQSTRRLVDLAFVVDRSGSLSSVWNQVKVAAQQFVSYFDALNDRMALVMFCGNTVVMDAINSGGRGFDKASVLAHLGNANTDGYTGTSEGLYQGWDQLRSVPNSLQSPLRIIVLFTDGAPNTFSGTFQVQDPSGVGFVDRDGALHTNDYPNVAGQGQDNPEVQGLWAIYATPSNLGLQWVSPTDGSYTSGTNTNTLIVNPKIPTIPLTSHHPTHVSSGIPTSFSVYDATLPGQRALIGLVPGVGYADHVQNANNTARNLAESVANAVRNDTSGAYPIHIYALGLGDLLNQNAGSVPETGASLIKRIANDRSSPDFNPNQTEGKFYFAGDPAQLNAAFEAVRSQIVRFTE